MDLNTFKTDPALDEGVWIPLDDAEIKIARIGSPKYQSRLRAKLRPHQDAIVHGYLKDSVATKIQIEVMADFILLDWRGNFEVDGKPLPYSRENAMLALEIDEFRAWVDRQARDLENFRAKEVKESVEAVAKN
jgi:hypothetical protein